MTAPLLCLLCGRPVPQGARDLETLGPLLCERHPLDDAVAAGVVGFPNLPDPAPPFGALTDALVGRRVVGARAISQPDDLLLVWDDGSVLDLFVRGYRDVFAQYVPGRSVWAAAVERLAEVREGVNEPVEAVLAAIDAGTALDAVEPGVSRAGDEWPEIVALHFRGRAMLDVEAVGWQTGEAAQLRVAWRYGTRPRRDSST